MNLAIRGIDANLGPRNADSFRADLHPDLKADLVPVRKDLANPPFNMSDWGGENLRQDVLKFRPISDHGNVNEITGKFGGADQLRNAVNQLQSLLYAT
jgi:type I restriction enzyme M protein